MTVDSVTQAKFERNLTWKRSWPRCFLGFLATVEVLMGLVIFLTELFNILMDFWHTNIFGGIWASLIIFMNWILIFVTVCCTTTIHASTCAFIWNIITLLALGVLIAFDIIFIINPYTCVLTPTCSTQSQIVSLNSIMQLIPAFENYTSYDSKKFFLEIQVGCASVAFVISLIYIFIFIACRIKIRDRLVQDYPAPPTAPPPPPLPPTPLRHEFPVAKTPPMPWTSEVPYAPYAPY